MGASLAQCEHVPAHIHAAPIEVATQSGPPPEVWRRVDSRRPNPPGKPAPLATLGHKLAADLEGVQGRWVTRSGRTHIIGPDFIEWDGGSTTRLRQAVPARDGYSTVVEGITHRCKYSGCKHELHWSDGDVWIRVPGQPQTSTWKQLSLFAEAFSVKPKGTAAAETQQGHCIAVISSADPAARAQCSSWNVGLLATATGVLLEAVNLGDCAHSRSRLACRPAQLPAGAELGAHSHWDESLPFSTVAEVEVSPMFSFAAEKQVEVSPMFSFAAEKPVLLGARSEGATEDSRTKHATSQPLLPPPWLATVEA